MLYTYLLPATYAANPKQYDRNGIDDLMHKSVLDYKSQLHMMSVEEVQARVWELGKFPIKYIVKIAVDTAASTVGIAITHQRTA